MLLESYIKAFTIEGEITLSDRNIIMMKGGKLYYVQSDIL